MTKLLSVTALLLAINLSCLIPYSEGFPFDNNNDAPDYTILSQPISLEEIQQAHEYWTQERLDAVIEHPVFSYGFNPNTPARADWDQAIDKAMHPSQKENNTTNVDVVTDSATQNLMDGNNSSFSLIDNLRGNWTDTCGFPLGTSPVPYDEYSMVPFQAIGWLVGHDPHHGYDYACSASLIGQSTSSNGDGGQVLSSAGHCIGGSGYFNTNLMFYPQRRADVKPYGGWAVSGIKAYSCWIAQGYWSCDYSFAQVDIKASLQGLGIAANSVSQGTYMACGYPAKSPFDGSIIECTRNAASKISKGSKMIYSKMTEGASGGPWIIGCTPNAGPPAPSNFANYVNGVTSHKMTTTDLWSPVFDDSTIALWKSVGGSSADMFAVMAKTGV